MKMTIFLFTLLSTTCAFAAPKAVDNARTLSVVLNSESLLNSFDSTEQLISLGFLGGNVIVKSKGRNLQGLAYTCSRTVTVSGDASDVQNPTYTVTSITQRQCTASQLN